MTDYLLDASAVAKRYVREPGTTWTISLTNPGPGRTILLAEITLAEIAAALAAFQRAPRGMTVVERDRVLARFLRDCNRPFVLVPVSRSVIDLAVSLTERHRLRGYDAVQLAAALTANQDLVAGGGDPLVFVAADDDLLLAAHAEGLAADNPLHHVDLDPAP